MNHSEPLHIKRRGKNYHNESWVIQAPERVAAALEQCTRAKKSLSSLSGVGRLDSARASTGSDGPLVPLTHSTVVCPTL